MFTLTTSRFSFAAAAMAACTLLAAGIAAQAQQDAPPEGARVSADRRLPPGVLAYASCPSVKLLKEKFAETSFGQLLQDPGMDDFLSQFKPFYEQASAQAEAEIGMSLDELLELVSGEVAIAAFRPPGQKLGLVSFVDVQSHTDALNKLLNELQQELKNKQAERSTSTYAETEVVTYRLPSEKPDGKPIQFSYFLRDGVLVTAIVPQHLEMVLDRWSGDSDSTFADNETYQYVMETSRSQAGGQPVLTWYITPVELILAGMSLSPELALQSAMVTGMLPTLGLNNLKAYGGAVELATSEYDNITRSVICLEGPAEGVLKVFQFPATISGPPEWVPASAQFYTGFHWDLETAYTAVGTLVDAYLGPGKFEGLVQQGADNPAGPGLHPKTDIIDRLTGVVHLFLMNRGGGPENTEGAVALGVTDAAAVEEVLKKVLESISEGPYRTQQVSGTTVYLPPEGRTGKGAIAVKGDQLYVASSISVMEGILSGTNAKTPLSQSEGYKKIADGFPSETSMLAYTDNSASLKAGYESLRGGDFDAFTEGKIDFSLLPPFDEIKKFFQPSAYYLVPIERGALSVQFTPHYQK